MTSSTRLIVTWQAREDIQDVFRYTSEVWGEDQAEAYDELLDRAFILLRDFPELGHASISPGDQREHHVRNHCVVDSYSDDTVTILRIVNPRRMRR